MIANPRQRWGFMIILLKFTLIFMLITWKIFEKENKTLAITVAVAGRGRWNKLRNL